MKLSTPLTMCAGDQKTLNTSFVVLGVLLLIASYHLPYRLSYTTSPRFAGVTLAAQVAGVTLAAQGLFASRGGRAER